MAEEMSKPNIIIFVPDEMRGDCVSLDGQINPVIQTPNLDKFAKDSVVFSNCFTVNPVCGPSRCCTFTGQYVHSNGHRSLYQLLQPHEENLFKFLRNSGYEVIYIGRNDTFSKVSFKESVTKRIRVKFPAKYKINPFPDEHRFRKSFYFGERTQEEGLDTDYHSIQSALKYLDTQPKKPFCLFIGLTFPHPPYTVEEPYFSRHKRKQIPLPIPPKYDDKPEFMRLMHERYGLNRLNGEDFKEIIATYYGMVTRVDHDFGMIIDKLKEINEYENSSIFFFADHGDYCGDYGLTEKWPNAFQDCLVKVPLIIKLPKNAQKDKVVKELVQTIDIFPTMLRLAKIETQYTHFGKDLFPLISGDVSSIRKAVYAEGGYNPREPQCFEFVVKKPDLPGIGIYYDKTNIPMENRNLVSRSAMIRTKEWKLIIRDKGKEELYDLMSDPDENENLIDSDKQVPIITELKEQLLRWYLRTSDNADYRRERLV